MKKFAAMWIILTLVCACVSVNAGGAVSPRERVSINDGWLFDRFGTMPDGTKRTEPATGLSPEQVAFDDAAWRKLDVPHDWGIEGPFRDELENNTGKLPWKGIGWYRKQLAVPAADQGRRVYVDFDGAMANAKVWCNGQHVGTWPYGYTSFRLDLTPFVKFGADNLLAVRLDTVKWGSRWYPGAGIYRNVWLVKTEPVHVGHRGVQVITTGTVAQLAVTVDNQGGQTAPVTVTTDIAGRKASATAEVDAGGSVTVNLSVDVPGAKPWSFDKPNLYTARVTVSVDGKSVDTYEQVFGFRTMAFTAQDGFRLNGKRIPIQGVCMHHDLGALGAAFNTRAAERQLEILKEMGCNAIRTAHNPPAPELMELTDRMGFLVMVEAFDCWSGGKKPYDYAYLYKEWHDRDLRAMVRNFRNHPSVGIWSIGNEISEYGGLQPAKMLADIVRSEDPTRPVTVGCNNAVRAYTIGLRDAVDVFGFNYCVRSYQEVAAYPGNDERPMLSSESSSCISSRGEYFFPVKDGPRDGHVNFQITSYDVTMPGWGNKPDDQFAALDKFPNFMGEFVWTGFDYLGEPTPYNADVSNMLNFSDPEEKAAMREELNRIGKLKVPSRSSYFGIVDLAGFKKDRFYLYQARWRPDFPMAHILPHWNWPERVGQVTPVHVYTSGDEAELFLNGQSLGRKKKGQYEYRLRWNEVVYEPGVLKVVAYKGGKEWATDEMKSTGPAAKLALEADRSTIKNDGLDLSFVTVRIADQDGLTVPRSKNQVTFEIIGPGEIVAVDNGDATSFEPFQARERKAYNGLALVVVRAQPGAKKPITLRAASVGLQGAAVTIALVRP